MSDERMSEFSALGEPIYYHLTCDERLHLVQVQGPGVDGEVGESIYYHLTCDERMHLVPGPGSRSGWRGG